MSINPFKSRYALTVVVFRLRACSPLGMATGRRNEGNLVVIRKSLRSRLRHGKRHHHGRG